MTSSLRYNVELWTIRLVRRGILLFPYATASSIGGVIFRTIGPYIRRSRKAKRHVLYCFPELSSKEADAIVAGMWENLGRLLAEFIHFERFTPQKFAKLVRIEGSEHLDAVIDNGCIICSAHLGNWELLGYWMAISGFNPAVVYREADNPKTDKLIQELRHEYMQNGLPKGRKGAKKMLEAIIDKRVVALMVDQKLKQGAELPFFSHPTKTSTVPARLSLRYGVPMVPVRVVRGKGHRCTIVIEPPLYFSDCSVDEKGAEAAMTQVNAIVEGWIREHPQQWMWLHHRWRKNLPPVAD